MRGLQAAADGLQETAVASPWTAAGLIVLFALALALALASRGLLRDLLGWLTLRVRRPFRVGDWIEAGGHRGTVTSMGPRTVRLRTPDGFLVILPNHRVTDGVVTSSAGGKAHRRVVTRFHTPADADIEEVRQIVYEAAVSSRYVDLTEGVRVTAEPDFRGTFLVRFRVEASVLEEGDEERHRTEVTGAVQRELVARGILSPEVVAEVRG